MKRAIDWHIKAIKLVLTALKSNRFWGYFVPGMIIMVIYLISEAIIHLLFNTAPTEETASWFARNIGGGWAKIGSAFDFIVTQAYIFLVITLLSPFNTLLSEKLDCRLTGQEFKFSLGRLVKDLLRMLAIVTVALTLELLCIAIWWIIAKIIGFDGTWFYSIISLLIGSFFYGFSFYDHSLERYGISVGNSLNFAFKNFAIVLATGICFKVMYYFPYIWDIPTIGIVLSPVITTMISTVVYLFHRGILNPDTSKLNSNE